MSSPVLAQNPVISRKKKHGSIMARQSQSKSYRVTLRFIQHILLETPPSIENIPIHSSIYEEISMATFDYRRVYIYIYIQQTSHP